MGSGYLGGFIGKDIALREWLHKEIKNWEEVVADLTSVAPHLPQTVYSGLLQESF
jgi:hypothetical protein